ncbi:MAG: hypothetical protein AAB786_01660 [Patescibacteria group bacterium]
MDFFSTKVAYANRFDDFLKNVNSEIVNPLITLLFALAVVYFLYGVFEFISNQENEENKTTGKSHMLWGVIGITIMMGVWAILNLVLSTIGVDSDIKINQSGNQGSVQINLPKYTPP